MNNKFAFQEYMFQNTEPDMQALISCLLGKNADVSREFGTIWQQMLPESPGFSPVRQDVVSQIVSSSSKFSSRSEPEQMFKIREGP